MRHLHVIQTLDLRKSGGLVGVVLLHEAMLRCGIDSRLIYNCSRSSAIGPQESVSVQPFLENRFYWGLRTAKVMRGEILRADVIHVHGLYTYLSYCAGKYCRAFGKKLVYHPHGTMAPVYLHRSKLKKGLVLCLFERKNFRAACAWRALSQLEREQIQASVPNARVIVVPNGVGLPSEDSIERGNSGSLMVPLGKEKKRIFLFLSRVAAVKGVDMLLDAWKSLGDELSGCELWIAGPDFDGSGLAAADFLRRNGLRNIAILGAVSDPDKEWLMRNADVFVLPSKGEGQSSAVLEAMSYGKPVLLTTTCYFPLAAESGAGLECSPDCEDISRKLKIFAESSSAELAMRGRAARRLISERYHIDKIAMEIDKQIGLIHEKL